MKWKPIIITASLLTIGGISYAAYRYLKKEKNLVEDYKAELIAIAFVSMTKDEWIIKFIVRLTNKSDIEATLKEAYADIYLNDTNIGYVINDEPIIIPAKGPGDIKLQVTVAPKILLKNAVDILTMSATLKDIGYRMKGYIKIQSGFVPVEVPFDESGKLSDFI